MGEALSKADLVVLGSGSLFTSVLAAAVVPGVAVPLADTAATRVLVLNLGPQVGESEGMSPDEHVGSALDHGLPVDVVLADPRFAPTDPPPAVELVVRPVGVDGTALHDPARLGAALPRPGPLTGAGKGRHARWATVRRSPTSGEPRRATPARLHQEVPSP